MTGPRLDPRVGTDLGPYHIESVIGRGGMGVVYLATHAGLDRRVALKLLTPDYADDEAFRARFLRESKLAASIDHPNIIPIYDAGQIEGTYYLAMRYVQGTDLQQRLVQGALAPRLASAILTQLASALDAAHAAGLVHRDVKPANVLIAAGQGSDGADHAYLTDFGLTKQRGSQTGLTQMGGFLGSLEYIAPEQIEGRAVDGQADQYALAGVAVTAFSGTPPFPRDADVAVINAHLHDAPPSVHLRRPELPIDVDAVIARAMAKEPDARYPTCGAFVADLRTTLGVTSGTERSIVERRRTGRGWLAAALAVGAIAVVVAVVVWLGGASGAPGTSPAASLAGAASGPTGTQTADQAVFPTAAEQTALALVPDSIRQSCVRGNGVPDAVEAGFTGRVRLSVADPPVEVALAPREPTASLTCTSLGASRVHFLWYQFAGGNRENAVDYLSLLAPRHGVTDGDCSTDAKARSSWSNDRLGSGLVICFRTAPFDGSPWLDWTFADGHMLALATRDDRDYDALYEWFQDMQVFLP